MSGGGKHPLVWITRPQPGAGRTAERLAAIGFEPLVLPLSEVSACEPDIGMGEADRAEFVAITSGNAVRLAPKLLLEMLKRKTAYAVGDATGAEARARGFARVVSAQGAVDDLAALIAGRENRGATGVYLCGRRRSGDLEGKLAASGIECRVAEVYATNEVSQPTYKLKVALTGRSPGAVLFHSAFSASLFAEAVTGAEADAFENTQFFAMSERIAQALPGWARGRVTVAEAPDEDNLLQSLRAAFSL